MKRDLVLKSPDFLPEKFVLHSWLLDDRRQPGSLVILRAILACPEGALRSRQEVVSPFGDHVRWNAEVPGDSLQSLSADEPSDGGGVGLQDVLLLEICCHQP